MSDWQKARWNDGERPHVCFLSSSAPRSSGDAYSPFILDLASALCVRGYRVKILTPHVAGSAEREILRGVPIRRYRYLPDPFGETLGLEGGMLPGLRRRPYDLLKVPAILWGQYRALAAVHAEDPIDLLHSHWIIPQGVIGGRFAGLHSVPHISTAHGSDLLGLRFPGIRGALRYVARRSSLITVNTEMMEKELRSRTGTNPETRVIPIGARVPTAADMVGDLGLRRTLPDARYIVGFLGRVVPEKGIGEFLRVVAHLRERGNSVAGLVVGTGSAEASARVLCEELDIEASVHFQGEVKPSEVSRFLGVMDLLLVPSHYEAQGIVAIEAMLLGVPVAAFDTGGLAEIVVDMQTGRSARAGDIDDLVKVTQQLLENPDERRRLSLSAYRRARAAYTLDTAADRFDRLYREILRVSE